MLNLTIITPEKTLVDAQVKSVSIPTTLGIITVLPHHQPLIAKLAPGELIYKTDKGQDVFVVDGGLLEVSRGSKVKILADAGERTDEINVEIATEAMQRAREVLANPKITEVEYAATLASLERSMARIRIARKHSGTRTRSITGEGTMEESNL